MSALLATWVLGPLARADEATTKIVAVLGAQPQLYPQLYGSCATRCGSTTTRRVVTTKRAGTTSIPSAPPGSNRGRESPPCARPGAVPRPGPARRAAWHPGVAELLFQVAHVRTGAVLGARPVHPVDEAEEHVALDDGRRSDYPPRRGVLRLRVAQGAPRADAARAFRDDVCRNYNFRNYSFRPIPRNVEGFPVARLRGFPCLISTILLMV